MNLTHIALRIANAFGSSDIVYLVDDEQAAETLAAGVRALLPAANVFHVRSSDALPGDQSPASPANAGHRVATLRALRLLSKTKRRPAVICILSGEAAGRRYPAPDAFDAAPPRLEVGATLASDDFSAAVETLGYFKDDRVDEPGEIAIRGEVIDIFPADASLPARIELDGNRIVAIRTYDPATQRTIDELTGLEIGRAAEPVTEPAVTILAHLRPGVLGQSDKADRARRRFIELARDAARAGDDVDAIEDDVWQKSLQGWRNFDVGEEGKVVPRFVEARSPITALKTFLKPLMRDRAFVLAGSDRDLRFLRSRLEKRLSLSLPLVADWSAICDLPSGSGATLVAAFERGACGDNRVVVAAADLLGSRATRGDGEAGLAGSWTPQEMDLRVGDVVVHEDHGVSKVLGIETAAGNDAGDMIVLGFAGDARRLISAEEVARLWRYGADADAVALDRLDGSSWQKRRGTIDAAIAETAIALVDQAKTRAKLDAPVLAPADAEYERFAAKFGYTETADQTRAIAAAREDLASGKPMDRLVIGDVGYGKTEVALRASAVAALAGFQVAIAAPTTVLVRQHYETFRARFEGTGVEIASLSRLSTAAERKAVKAGLADGTIGIVIGTAALRGKDVSYAKLGLVIIDEEQRFGAADKARLRGDGQTHLLTLSATPIPRTLQTALVGLQQMSAITTPPARRQPVRTSVDSFDEGRVRTALLREKGRGGQSFIVVPRIEEMASVAELVRRTVPELEIVAAHGKLPPAQIDEAMVGFAAGAGDILLATNIIEAGLDVPRANTMIVWRADRFGLAQLHQLRGRVGRGSRRGQVMLLTDDETKIGDRTLKRLRALAAFDQLGAGFDIAAQDLDMRGAGELLGEDQAGHTKLIGTGLYQHLLGAALQHARGEDSERWSPTLNLEATGRLPADWIPEPDLRLSVYARLSRVGDEAGLDALEEELVDRFGPLPPAAEVLIVRSRIRLAAHALQIERIDAGPAAIALTFRSGAAPIGNTPGLREKNGRWLHELGDDPGDQMTQVQALLETLSP